MWHPRTDTPCDEASQGNNLSQRKFIEIVMPGGVYCLVRGITLALALVDSRCGYGRNVGQRIVEIHGIVARCRQPGNNPVQIRVAIIDAIDGKDVGFRRQVKKAVGL